MKRQPRGEGALENLKGWMGGGGGTSIGSNVYINSGLKLTIWQEMIIVFQSDIRMEFCIYGKIMFEKWKFQVISAIINHIKFQES